MTPKPPFDPELEEFMAQMPMSHDMQPEMIPMMRSQLSQIYTAEVILGKPIQHEEVQIPVSGGEITLSIFRPTSRVHAEKLNPGIYYIHGGGLVMGNRFLGMSVVSEWVEKFEATCVSVEYRLAPEHPYPTPLEDCYAGLEWMESHFSELGIDESRVMIAGQSAGGGLAAAVAIHAQNQGGPRLCAQLLMCPMVDHRNITVSSQQFLSKGTWCGKNNQMAWACYLGDHGKAEGEEVDVLASPGLAATTELSNLPTTFIDVGTAETFRDEDIEYAKRLLEAGVQVELHVWPGGIHGFDQLMPTSALSQRAIQSRTAWVNGIFSKQ